MTTRMTLGAILLASVAAACGPSMPQPAEGPAVDEASRIVASLDLTAVSDDRLRVDIEAPRLDSDEVLFRLPRVVQGTYDVSDFGSYVEDLAAYDQAGAPMATDRVDTNTWRIADARRLDRITYYANDTYDQERTSEHAPFSPSGTNIDPRIFVLNLHGFVGYFEGMTEHPYEIRIVAPVGMAKSSPLEIVAADTSADGGTVTDVYEATRYFQVTDNPMMYGDLDIVRFRVEDIDVEFSLYSPTQAHRMADLDDAMQRMMEAQRAYLGDVETTNSYDAYVFLAGDDANSPTGFGALEHHTSTVAVFPESFPPENLADQLVDVISHEFFHIVSPLGVHSDDIHDFDYNAPTFSKHLWMYEGQTEYFASHFQVYEGLEAPEAFYEKMAGKIDAAAGYDDAMSFTIMSENILDEPYAENYGNVYQKGALIGMCLDVIMRDESGGERSTMSMMKELSDRYGVERAFDDDRLIDEITEMTYPAVGDFLRTHVVGGTPIDYSDCLRPAGLEVVREDVPSTLLLLSPEVPFIDLNPSTGEIFFQDVPLNTTLVALGVQGGDVIKSMNGTEYDLSNIGALVQATVALAPESDLRLVVERDGSEVVLEGRMGTPTVERSHIREMASASPAQLATRRAWLNR